MNLPENYKLLLRRIGFLLFVYFLGRLLFLIFNVSYFYSAGFIPVASTFFFGLRYDITVIVITNLLFIVLHLFGFPFFYRKGYQIVLKILFLVVNIPFLLITCIDFGLFRFTGKRSGMEIFSIMSFGNDFVNTLPKMISDFWYLLLIFFLLVIILIKGYPVRKLIDFEDHKRTRPVAGIFLFLVFVGMIFIGFRGGIQFKPLGILSASRYGTGPTTTLVLNTPFTIIKTFGKETVEDVRWMSIEEASKITPVRKSPSVNKSFTPKNVVLIILESFGKEYVGSLNSTGGYTPFLDSLIREGLVFDNAYANAKRSIEGIPAIVAGIPAMMNDPFIASTYSGNSITTIPMLLKTKGYSSIFFHGGTNGTMGFDNFCKLAGFDRYFGRSEYGDDKDYDGSWGIYDEPFLRRAAVEMDKMKSPFLSVIFTLSSHHPYKIPDTYEKTFAEGSLPIHKSIRYADHALRTFFENASKMPWFRNTVFILTADHTALSEKPFYRNRVGLFSIPLIVYSPGDSLMRGKSMATTQQIDIMPGIMDYLHFDKSFFSFGNSMFDTTSDRYAISFVDGSYQLLKDDYVFMMDTIGGNSLYDFTSDSLLKKNLFTKDNIVGNEMELKLKSVLQQFNHSLIHNSMR